VSKQPKKRLIVDLTPEEHAIVSARARAAGLTISQWFRKLAKLPMVKPGQRTDLRRKQ